MPVEFKLPELGENVEKGDVVRVLVVAGDVVTVDQPVLELETDKATIEVPTSIAGKIAEVRVKVGDKVKVGQAVFVIEDAASANGAGPHRRRLRRRPRLPLQRRPQRPRLPLRRLPLRPPPRPRRRPLRRSWISPPPGRRPRRVPMAPQPFPPRPRHAATPGNWALRLPMFRVPAPAAALARPTSRST